MVLQKGWRPNYACSKLLIQGSVPSPSDAPTPESFAWDRLLAVDSREVEHDPVDMWSCYGTPLIFQWLGEVVSTTLFLWVYRVTMVVMFIRCVCSSGRRFSRYGGVIPDLAWIASRSGLTSNCISQQ